MKYKVLVLDIDGTLVASDHQISPRTTKTLLAAQQKGLIVVLASGRPTPGMMALAQELQLKKYGGFILSYNGGRITNMQTGEIVHEQFLTASEAHEVYEVAKSQGVNIMAYDGNVILTEGHDEYIQIESKINEMSLSKVSDFKVDVVKHTIKTLTVGPPERIAEVEQLYLDKFGDRFSICRSMPFFLEVMPHGVNKAASLARLLDYLGLSTMDMIACGDGYNDVEMIRFAGFGVAMENAVDEVKAVADHVTKSNDEDGIVEVIEKFIF